MIPNICFGIIFSENDFIVFGSVRHDIFSCNIFYPFICRHSPTFINFFQNNTAILHLVCIYVNSVIDSTDVNLVQTIWSTCWEVV